MNRQPMIEIFLLFIQALEKNEIPYMVVGSIASSAYGDPRLTHDLDIVVKIEPGDAKLFPKIFPEKDYYCPALETIEAEIKRGGQFNLVHHESGYKFDLIVSKNKLHDSEQFKRRQKKYFWNDQDVFMATPEDVILKKLEFYKMGHSEKHIRDIESILRNTPVDQLYLDHWISTLSLQTEWQKVKKSNPVADA